MSQDRSAGRAIRECWLRLWLFAGQHHMSDCFESRPRTASKGRWLREIWNKQKELILKTTAEVHREHDSRGTKKTAKLSLFCQSWACFRKVFDLFKSLLPYKNPVSWNLNRLTGPTIRTNDSTPCFITRKWFWLMLSPSAFALLLQSILGLMLHNCCTVVVSLQQLHPQKPVWLNRFGYRCRWWFVWGFKKLWWRGWGRHICKSWVLYGPLFHLA